MKLTKAIIDELKFEGKTPQSAHVVYDDTLPGFGIRVWPSGRKTFVLRYRFCGGCRYLSLGAYGPLTLVSARDRAKVFFGQILSGVDPLAEKRRKAKGETVKELCSRYLQVHAPKKKTSRNDAAMIRLYIEKSWGGRKFVSVTPADVRKLHQKIGETHATQANRVRSLVSKLWNFARVEDMWPAEVPFTNPVFGVTPFPEVKRREYLKPGEIAIFLDAIATVENRYIRGLFLLYILEPGRKSEIKNLKWSDIDFDEGRFTVLDTKSGRALELPLSSAALTILAAMPRVQGNPHVFVGRRDGKPLASVNKAWERVREKAGLPRLRIHDLRKVVNWLRDTGTGLDVIQRMLNHSDPRVTADHYAFVVNGPLKIAVQQLSDTVEAAVGKDRISAVLAAGRG